MPGDVYNNMIILHMIDIPSHILGGLLLHRVGIKYTAVVGCVISALGGILLIVYGGDASVSEPSSIFIIILALAKGGSAIITSAIYIGTATIFPAIFSGLAIGLCSASGKVFASTSSLIAELAHPIPMIIYTVCTILVLPCALILKISKRSDSFIE